MYISKIYMLKDKNKISLHSTGGSLKSILNSDHLSLTLSLHFFTGHSPISKEWGKVSRKTNVSYFSWFCVYCINSI